MAVLLNKFLADPHTYSQITRYLDSRTPPLGLDEEAWQFRDELPLHVINYLRDATSRILSSSVSKQTPSKGKRSVKYNYNSPVKSVSKDHQKKPPRKEKKKVKLFPAGVLASQDKGAGVLTNQDAGSDANHLDGIDELPATPVRNHKLRPASRSDEPQTPAAVKTQPRSEDREPRRIFPKQTPSPQPLSLADFIKPESGRRTPGLRSPKKTKSRVKASTPNPESFMSRLGRVEETDRRLDLDSKDLFPDIGEGVVKKKRIKPISLNSQPDTHSTFGRITERPGGLATKFCVEEVEKESVDDRGMMKEAATITPFKTTLNTRGTPSKPTSRPVNPVPLIVPASGSVTGRIQLDTLVSLYSYIIQNNLMPNYNVELYFIIELLQVESSEAAVTDQEMFESVHNCVYFSVQVLHTIYSTLQCLDRATLKLLAENTRLRSYSTHLAARLQDMYERISVPSPPKLKPSGLQNVSFQTETDNRINFPSTASFHDFKKQRDKFYTLVRSWSEHQRGKDYEFSQVFGAQVDELLRMHPHTVNYSHFSSLFLHQLLAMCRGEQPLKGAQDPSLKSQPNLAKDDLSQLKTLDPLKYAQLTARLVNPSQLEGPCPPPSFTGAQEFFRDFVLYCPSLRFLAHLKNIIIAEIYKLEGLYFGSEENSLLGRSDLSFLSDISQDESFGLGSTDSNLNQQVQQTILTLRLLGKFLGFIEFSPYVFPDNQSKGSVQLDDPVLLTRKDSAPPLNIKQVLERGESEGRLVLSLPWIIEYLAQLDDIGYHIEYYKSLAIQIIKIYQNSLKFSSPVTSHSVAFFLSVYVGWWLERDEFPRDLVILARFEEYSSPSADEASLDRTMVVPSTLLYECCPWLSEIKVLLSTSQPSSLPSLDSYRKITPISAPKPSSRDQGSSVQKEMEESFLGSLPASLRRTTEFLAERLASNTIKLVRNKLVPQYRDKYFKIIRGNYENITTKDLEAMSGESTKEILLEIANNLLVQVRKDAESALDILVSVDIHPAAKNTCVEITVRNLTEKVDQWGQQNLTCLFFFNEFQGERDRLVKSAEKEGVKDVDGRDVLLHHDPSSPSPSGILIALKKDILDLLTCSAKASSSLGGRPGAAGSTGRGQMESIEQCILYRGDTTPAAVQALGAISVDWILSMIALNPDLVTSDLISSSLRVWKIISPVQILSILSPTSLLILSQSQSPDNSWSKMGILLRCLLEEKLLPSLALEDSCLQLLQQDWDEDVLDSVVRCLEDLGDQGDWDGALDWIPGLRQKKEEDWTDLRRQGEEG